jgi:RNA polymerase sigma-70 factor (ECF subfamily)
MAVDTLVLERTAGAEALSSGEGRLASLFDSHHDRLYRLARRLSPNADDARDLLQDTFLRAAQKLASVPTGATSEEAWLVRVLINLARDRWRRQSVRVRANHLVANLETVPSGEMAVIAKATIWSALQRLPPRRRAILIMCELEGLSIATVARLVGVTQITVRCHLSKGRRDLARVIGNEGRAGQ